ERGVRPDTGPTARTARVGTACAFRTRIGDMRSVLLPAGLLVLACSPGSTPAASDAIPITFSDSVADIELLPELVIGDAESDVYFHAIQDVAVDEDSGIYVSDRAREGIHVFDASGRLVRR